MDFERNRSRDAADVFAMQAVDLFVLSPNTARMEPSIDSVLRERFGL